MAAARLWRRLPLQLQLLLLQLLGALLLVLATDPPAAADAVCAGLNRAALPSDRSAEDEADPPCGPCLLGFYSRDPAGRGKCWFGQHRLKRRHVGLVELGAPSILWDGAQFGSIGTSTNQLGRPQFAIVHLPGELPHDLVWDPSTSQLAIGPWRANNLLPDFGTTSTGLAIAIGNLSGNQWPDIIVSEPDKGLAVYARASADAPFEAWPDSPIHALRTTPTAVALGNITNGEWEDIVACINGSLALFSRPKERDTLIKLEALDSFSCIDYAPISLYDLDFDGDLDIVLAQFRSLRNSAQFTELPAAANLISLLSLGIPDVMFYGTPWHVFVGSSFILGGGYATEDFFELGMWFDFELESARSNSFVLTDILAHDHDFVSGGLTPHHDLFEQIEMQDFSEHALSLLFHFNARSRRWEAFRIKVAERSGIELYVMECYELLSNFTLHPILDRVGTVCGETLGAFNESWPETSKRLSLSDVDGDGLEDIVFCQRNTVMAAFQDADGRFSLPVAVHSDQSNGNLSFFVQAAVVRPGPSGTRYIVALQQSHQSGSYSERDSSILVYEFTSGSWTISSPLTDSFNVNSNLDNTGAFQLVDYNNDGHLDFVFAHAEDGHIQVLNGTGEMTFKANPNLLVEVTIALYMFGQDTLSFQMVDMLYRDGDKDIIACTLTACNIFANVQYVCGADCVNRGVCSSAAEASSNSNVLTYIAAFQGPRFHTLPDFDAQATNNLGVIGACWCQQGYQGESCQLCDFTRYGVDCEFSCPPHSSIPATQLATYPRANLPSECECLASFMAHTLANGSSVCVCGPGLGYDPTLQVCSPCAIGSFSPVADTTRCSRCEEVLIGSTTLDTGSVSAAQCHCPMGSTARIGSTSNGARERCVECPKHTVSLATGCVCQEGFYHVQDGSEASGFRCDACDSLTSVGLRCDLENVTLATLPLRSGFWRTGPRSTDIRRCPEPAFCAPASRLAPAVRIAASDLYCAPNHTGTYCSNCVEGTSLRPSLNCEPCTPATEKRDRGVVGSLIAASVIIAALPSLALWRVARRAQRKGMLGQNGRNNQTPSGKLSKMVGNFVVYFQHIGVKVRIVFGFFQVAISFLSRLEGASAGSNLGVIFDLDPSVAIASFRSECVFHFDFNSALIIYTLYPIAIVALLGACLLIVRCTYSSQVVQHTKSFFVWCVYQLCFLVYPGVSAKLFGAFSFEEFDDHRRVLRSDPSLDYEHQESIAMRTYAAFFIVLYTVGILALFFFSAFAFASPWALRKSRQAERARSEHEQSSNAALADTAHASFRRGVAFLCTPYLPVFYWFETYELARKLFLTAGFVLIQQAWPEHARIIFLTSVALFLLALNKCRPYVSPTNYLLADAQLWMLLIIAFVSNVAPVDSHANQLTFTAMATASALSFVIAMWADLRVAARSTGPTDPHGAGESHGGAETRRVSRGSQERAGESSWTPAQDRGPDVQSTWDMART